MTSTPDDARPLLVVVGAGPAGLMAAEIAARDGCRVVVIDQMAAPGRKLLMAGRGGLNLTHSEPLAAFLSRYGAASDRLAPLVTAFDPATLTAWAEALGQETFVGSSGRVFPKAMKASPLLRAWLRRLADLGVTFRFKTRFCGFCAEGRLMLSADAADPAPCTADAVILALGGASWPRLGSDGAWVQGLAAAGVSIAPLAPYNAGVHITWSAHLTERLDGSPLKRIALRVGGVEVRGEAVITRTGLEGGVAYALNGAILAGLADSGGEPVEMRVDLRPDLSPERLTGELSQPRGRQSMAAFLKRRAGLSSAAVGVLREPGGGRLPDTPAELAALIKGVPLAVTGLAGLARAISSRGGVRWDGIDDTLMLVSLPGVFVAGEMIDWEAPTGGYLLQAVLATGAHAGRQATRWLTARPAHVKRAGPGSELL
ncbi:MAG: TIGR03862 family flavoprotein [Hyphomicrobiaceae bacterium]|nr:TIGR03862 family flavoprotein [Hyphomicrobiaceae bacterium]